MVRLHYHIFAIILATEAIQTFSVPYFVQPLRHKRIFRKTTEYFDPAVTCPLWCTPLQGKMYKYKPRSQIQCTLPKAAIKCVETTNDYDFYSSIVCLHHWFVLISAECETTCQCSWITSAFIATKHVLWCSQNRFGV